RKNSRMVIQQLFATIYDMHRCCSKHPSLFIIAWLLNVSQLLAKGILVKGFLAGGSLVLIGIYNPSGLC
ncbi:hypothetical protein RYX45_24530, partial [Alkalihalophilus pseudofirmus]